MLTGVYTDDELKAQLQSAIYYMELNRKPATDRPTATILGGQPGAGKTVMADSIVRAMDQDVLFISGDSYRKYNCFINLNLRAGVLHFPIRNRSGKDVQMNMSKQVFNKPVFLFP